MSETDAGPNVRSGVHLWLILMKAYRALAQVDAGSMAASGLGLSDFAVLEILLHKGPLPVNTIGRQMMLTSGSITTAVDRLEEKQLVRRQACPNDRRVTLCDADQNRSHPDPAGFQGTCQPVGDRLRTAFRRGTHRAGHAAEKAGQTWAIVAGATNVEFFCQKCLYILLLDVKIILSYSNP